MKTAKKVNGDRLYPKYTGEEKMVSIHNDPRAVREANKIGAKIYKLSGDWTGYEYETIDRYIVASEAKKVRMSLKKIDEKNKNKKRNPITDEQRRDRWAKRLARLGQISLDEALELAEEKASWEYDQIERAAMTEIQGWKIPAWKRAADKKYDRVNHSGIYSLLRPITDIDHANAILAASRRHNRSDYDTKLREARDMGLRGEEVKEYARSEMQFA